MNDELKSILERVRTLYLKYGIKSITMDDVARELGISKKTLYQYVCDKNELVAKVFEMETDKKECNVKTFESEGANAIEEMIMVNKHVNKMLKEHNPSTEYDLKKYYPEVYRKYYETRRGKIFEWVKSNIIRGKTEGLYRSDVNEDLIAKLVIIQNEGIADTELFNITEYTSQKSFVEILVYHIRGIANEKGVKVLNNVLDNMKEL
jgi:AcrR family transcriptional regulator